MDFAIRTQGLRRTFGDFIAVDGIDLEVPRALDARRENLAMVAQGR